MSVPTAKLLVFVSGFVVMVLEIVGARILARDFGGSFYVWVSQIGVILIALALLPARFWRSFRDAAPSTPAAGGGGKGRGGAPVPKPA